jgi:tyrosine phenol-lyase
MKNIRWHSGQVVPLELHKTRIVQKLNLLPPEERLAAMEEAGFNTFLLKNKDVFLDMLTDSGVNAMSDNQLAAMMRADDSYAGSETFYRLQGAVKKMFGMKHFLPAHQGRACEHIIAQAFVKPDQVTLMNYHFTTTKSHIVLAGGSVEELIIEEGLNLESEHPFKGNMDEEKLKKRIEELGSENIAFVRMEAGTNLIGGQPFSLGNFENLSRICRESGVLLVLDASLLADNLHFIKTREEEYRNATINEITLKFGELADIIYFSARKLGSARGGAICTSDDSLFKKMQGLVPLFEGFLTYGGMSAREMEAMAVGLEETLDEDMISQGPIFIEFMATELLKRGIPVVTPPGGLGCHVNVMAFLDHIPQEEYPAGSLAAAFYLASGVRGMERGTLSEQRDENGVEPLADMELLRLALPRRVFTMSQVLYAVDRMTWLYENRKMIGGLEWVEEPDILRFFFGRLKAKGDWPQQLIQKFRRDFGDSL